MLHILSRLWVLLLCAPVLAVPVEQPPVTLEEARDRTLKLYVGPVSHGVDTSTLTGKVVCGYQGWFNTATDGSGRGWVHWTKGRGGLVDGNANVDIWPDMTEYTFEERYPTGFKFADGRPAEVFSSFNRLTVLRHFQWMREYGIDGAFAQRFAGGLRDPRFVFQNNAVLAHVREGANANGRAYAVMYDLTGLGANRIEQVMDDWKSLRLRMKITDDAAYLKHHGKPLVAVWGAGFNDNRAYTTEDCRKLLDYLKNDPEVGGCAVMLGVPTYWREMKRDTLRDPKLLELLARADVVSPWSVGRYRSPEQAIDHAQKVYPPDIAWCAERKVDYLPVIFPGFSWTNMRGSAKDSIPRLKGQFLWTQFCEAKKAGASMLYVAMFDEVDEGTAIFKCGSESPVAKQSRFIDFEGLPSDYYLKLTGAGGRVLRGELPASAELPAVTAPKRISTSSTVPSAPQSGRSN